jgi:hypothetical protein
MTILTDRPIGRDDRIPPAALVLGWAGVIPFASGAIALWLTARGARFESFVVVPLLAYGAVILSFLGGARWALGFRLHGTEAQARAFAFSIIPALTAWAGVALYRQPLLAFALLAGGHTVQGWFDVTTSTQDSAPAWYPKLRLQLTVAAVATLIVAAAAVAFRA